MSLLLISLLAVVAVFLFALTLPLIIEGQVATKGAVAAKDWAALSDLAMRGSLKVLLVPSMLLGIYFLYVGGTFGFALWNVTNLKPTIIWLATISFPAWILIALNWSQEDHRRTVVSFVSLWSVAILWIVSLVHKING